MSSEIYVDRYYTLIDSGFSKTSAITKVCFEFGLRKICLFLKLLISHENKETGLKFQNSLVSKKTQG